MVVCPPNPKPLGPVPCALIAVCSLRELLWQALPAIDYYKREASASVPSPYSGSPLVVEELPLPPELALPEPALLPVWGPPSLGSGLRSIVSSETAVQSALDQVLMSCNASLQAVYGVSWMRPLSLERLKGVTLQSYAQGVNGRPDFVLGAPVDSFCSFLVAKRVTPSGGGDAALVGLPAGLGLAAPSAGGTARAAGKGDGGGGSSGAADASGASAKVVDIEELPDPEFLLGQGLTGNIFATTWRGRPVAVKATVDPALLPLLRNEVNVYEWPTVRPLQGTLLPELVGWGAADSPPSAWLLTALVEGGVLLDPEVHPEHRCPAVEAAAAEALAALHAAGFLHGDVRADNLLVVIQPGPGGSAAADGGGAQPPPNRPAAQPDGVGPPPPPRVVLIDLGLARPMLAGGEGRDAAQAELAELRALFCPAAASHGWASAFSSRTLGGCRGSGSWALRTPHRGVRCCWGTGGAARFPAGPLAVEGSAWFSPDELGHGPGPSGGGIRLGSSGGDWPGSSVVDDGPSGGGDALGSS
ncbi:hypothetical protein HYH03_007886 [Edaphochlamys debaryana]|uniref:Protein kinase domain-containing protein n=1 Tax=Edaphochlamys debaryana TaxID=47281 RepID=A0A835Y4G1_9CHLO|nr:hypothetical protein HYH03_007886 [Edaphochlamys debaryana]|eukprot:KAG2493956.1 hypothetical protein HYH03_007886 [Edaphochlamys debaryana]